MNLYRPRKATEEEIEAFHAQDYIEFLQKYFHIWNTADE
jgi:acetoin utilization deacetylase AcuC-like enzyme